MMIRNLKALGLALVAVFAMSAMVASAASAQQAYLTSDGPAKLNGTEVEPNKLTAFGLGVECEGSTYTGEAVNGGFLEHGTEATITPHYKQENCQVGSFPATVDTNGCDFNVTLKETTGGADTYGVKYAITCEITVTIWFSEAAHLENKEPCTIHIGAQADLTGGHLTDNTNGTVTLNGTVEGIKATKTKSNANPFLCPAATTETGKFDVNALVTGENEAGKATAIGVSELGDSTGSV